MRILISGSSGTIGSALVPSLASEGYEVVRLVRKTPGDGEVQWDPEAGSIDAAGVEGFDGVVNLASAPWPLRWTAKAKERIRSNRLATNGLLAKTLMACNHKPAVLICASGMGIYPDSGEREITEDSELGTDFLAMLQRDGEAAAMKAEAAGIRVVNLRIPAVIHSGAIRGSLGRIGKGQQWSSWIGRDELVNIIKFVLAAEGLKGPLNSVSPNPLRNADMIAKQTRVLGQKPGVPMPAWLLRLMLGEMAEELILPSRRMLPRRLLDVGYEFLYPQFEDTLQHELKRGIIARQA